MFNYAITINKNHNILSHYELDLNDSLILEMLTNILIIEFDYVYLVGHTDSINYKLDHIHGLITSHQDLDSLKKLKMFHVEIVRNPQAYIKYMLSHTLHSQYIPLGELSYQENDDMITYSIIHGLVKTVEKYGMIALKNYKNLKEFINDYHNQNKKI